MSRLEGDKESGVLVARYWILDLLLERKRHRIEDLDDMLKCHANTLGF